MRRKRVEAPYTRRHESLDKFLYSRPRAGLHAFKVGAQWIDVLFEDRGSPTTLVAFHGAASSKVQTLPFFTGRGLADSLGWNLIAPSDPSLALGDINLAWFLGNRGMGPLRPKLSPTIHHLLGDTQPVLFGGSGGAYAAILFAQDFPGASVVVFNPRLNIEAPPKSAVDTYLEVCHRTKLPVSPKTIRRIFVVEDVADLYSDGLTFDLHMIQNSGDKLYLENQVKPFAQKYRHDSRFNLITEDFGRGHAAPIPREFLHQILRSVAKKECSE